MKRYFSRYNSFLALIFVLLGCSKQDDWLNRKSNKEDVVPSKLSDYQALLDNAILLNQNYSDLGLVSADNFYVSSSTYSNSQQQQLKNAYTWQKDINAGQVDLNWSLPYGIINYSNVVLDGLVALNNSSDPITYNSIKGSALFFRSFNYYVLNELYAVPYSKSTASTSLAVPLRLNSDVNIKSTREPLAKTFDQLFGDLTLAAKLLPVTPAIRTRPCRPAAYGLLAKLFLITEQYDSSYKYSDLALIDYNQLIDFNTISPDGSSSPFPSFTTSNPEIIFYAEMSINPFYIYPSPIVDSLLYQSYATNDIRKVAFFRPNPIAAGYTFKGSYTGSIINFSGIGVNELYLIRAESNARLGNFNEAIIDLNTLLRNRWVANAYTNLTATSKDDAIAKILTERRKELPFTGILRWEDLRRLNKDPNYGITLKRIINGEEYLLPPNDPRYALPIPDLEVKLSGIPQNQR